MFKIYEHPIVSINDPYRPLIKTAGTRYRDVMVSLIDICLDNGYRIIVEKGGEYFSTHPIWKTITIGTLPNSALTVWSIAHEVGHIMTFNNYTSYLYDVNRMWVETLAWGWAERFFRDNSIEITEEMIYTREMCLLAHRTGGDIDRTRLRAEEQRPNLVNW